jgi:hypothetical protein
VTTRTVERAAQQVTEKVTVAMPDQPKTAAMLCMGREPECSPQCLLAVGTEARHCSCICAGRYHGRLAHAPVEGTRRTPPPERPDEPALFPVTIFEEAEEASA